MPTTHQWVKPDNIKITFGLIVLNGIPFIEYNLRALYPFAHQIIVVEGAAPSAKRFASAAGHSLDGTLDVLYRFKVNEDPENKLLIVTAEDEGRTDGFWSEKDEMSQAYAKRATGNYLWQIDSDEFYLEEDMSTIVKMLSDDPGIKAVSFSMKTFWGSPAYLVEGFFLYKFIVHRIFAWGPGYKYLTHRPPIVLDDTDMDIRKIKWITPKDMRSKGIYMYHYELLFPKQVIEKCSYYAGAEWTTSLKKADDWARNCYLKMGKPFRVHMTYDHLSWLEKYKGEYPLQIRKMIEDVNSGRFKGIQLRIMDDVNLLLSKFSFRFRRAILKGILPIDSSLYNTKMNLKNTFVGRILLKVKRQYFTT